MKGVKTEHKEISEETYNVLQHVKEQRDKDDSHTKQTRKLGKKKYQNVHKIWKQCSRQLRREIYDIFEPFIQAYRIQPADILDLIKCKVVAIKLPIKQYGMEARDPETA